MPIISASQTRLFANCPREDFWYMTLGNFSFGFFDEFTKQGKYFVARMREKTAYKEIRALSDGPFHRDRIIIGSWGWEC